MRRNEVGLWENAAISPEMAGALSAWQRAFYGEPDWKLDHIRLSGLPGTVTGYVATLVTGEM